MQRNATITSEAPTSSCSTCRIAELKVTSEKATVTCDQPGCGTRVGVDMGVLLELGRGEGVGVGVCMSALKILRLAQDWLVDGAVGPLRGELYDPQLPQSLLY
jgi:hypothetical protein